MARRRAPTAAALGALGALETLATLATLATLVALAALAALAALPRAGAEECVVSRRLPPFALRAVQKSAEAMAAAAPAPASRAPGGACHMGRLARVAARAPEADTDTHFSTQMCARNSTALTCAELAQNASDAGSAAQRLRVLAARAPGDGAQDVRARHARARLCSGCERQDVDAVLTRLMGARARGARPTTGRRQLSVGVPQRLSAERLLAAQLHRSVCNASATCPALEAVLTGACAGPHCMRRGAFLGALLNREHFERAGGAAGAPQQALAAASDALWRRNWVWCPHSEAAPAEFAQCSGSVSKAEWLNVSTRARACAAQIPTTGASTTSVNFCLLNARTVRLCKEMVVWRRKAQSIVCTASGRCPTSDFFYSPSTFDLREQQFVYDSVLEFYSSDAKRSCPAAVQGAQQQAANYANMGNCASVLIQPMLEIVEQLREGKRLLVLMGYHYYRVQFYVVQLLVSATMDTAAALASTGLDSVGRVADSLLREVVALMQVIGGFVDQLGDAIMELAMSRGVGKTIKDMLVFLCQAIELLHNTVWSYFICPILQFALLIAEFMISVLQLLLELVRIVLFGNGLGVLEEFIRTCREIVTGISRALGTACLSRSLARRTRTSARCRCRRAAGRRISRSSATTSSCRARRRTRASLRRLPGWPSGASAGPVRRPRTRTCGRSRATR